MKLRALIEAASRALAEHGDIDVGVSNTEFEFDERATFAAVVYPWQPEMRGSRDDEKLGSKWLSIGSGKPPHDLIPDDRFPMRRLGPTQALVSEG